jgi:hypothetical protein
VGEGVRVEKTPEGMITMIIWDSDQEYLDSLSPKDRVKVLRYRVEQKERDIREIARKANPEKYLPEELVCEWCERVMGFGVGDFECTTIICAHCVATGKVKRTKS